MLPIVLLPVAGIFLGIGGSLSNETMLRAYGLYEWIGPGTFMGLVLTVMRSAGDIIFRNLPLIFAMGVAIGMAKAEKETAALAGAIAFFVMHSAIGAMIQSYGGPDAFAPGMVVTIVGIQSFQLGVMGGTMVGLGVAFLHNRFYKIELPTALAFFGGIRFIPIVSATAFLFVGIGMFYIWPPIQNGIISLAEFIRNSGYLGTFIYGFMERLLLPFGLHHMFYLPFWQTGIGGIMQFSGRLVVGAQNIFFAQLSDPNTKQFSLEATRFLSGRYPFVMFGLPGAALAMYHAAKSEKKKMVGGLLLSASLTAVLTGISEPLEFTFLFAAPVLYGIHCLLAGASYVLMQLMHVGVGMTFSSGLIDLLLYGVFQGGMKTNWIAIPIVGVAYFVLYYVIFRFLIEKFDWKTLGRDDTPIQRRAKKLRQGKPEATATTELIVEALGGKDNISYVDACTTRLRTTVHDPDLVDQELLKESGAAGIVQSGKGVQIVYGPKVTVIKSRIREYLSEAEATPSAPIEKEETVMTINQEPIEESARASLQYEEIVMPTNGELVDLAQVPDDVFSQKMMGEGFAVRPSEGVFYAPVAGKVAVVFETKHAIAFKTNSGLEVLLHMGIDTVMLEGKGFEVHVEAGQDVNAGDLIATMDLKLIEESGYPSITPIIFMNLDEDLEVEIVEGIYDHGESGKISITKK